MKIFLSFLLSLLSLSVLSQTTPLTFAQIAASAPDIQRPTNGAEVWIGQNTVNIPVQGTNTQRLDVYWRFSYTDVAPYNGLPGTFNFNNTTPGGLGSSTCFDCQINAAIDRGQRFSFTVMELCTYCSGHGSDTTGATDPGGNYLFYPLYLHNAMQGEANKDFAVNGAWWPNFNSPTWLNAWKAMYTALNSHIMTGHHVSSSTGQDVNYRDIVSYIDVGGYGQTGEWTGNPYSSTGPSFPWLGPAGTEPTVATLDSIISYGVHVFNNFYCVNQIAAFDGNQLTNTKIPPAVGYYALTTTNSKGPMGWRWESFGWDFGYIHGWLDLNHTVFTIPSGPQAGLAFRFDTAIMNRYKFSPIVGEPADLGSAGSGTSAFAAMPGQMPFYHVNSFGNGNLDNNINNSTAWDNYRASAKAAGSKFTLTGGSMTTALTVNGAFNLSLSWQNIGPSPLYYDYDVKFEIRSGATVLQTFTSSKVLKGFLPGSAVTTSDNFVLSGVPAGSYGLYMILRPRNNFGVNMPINITGQNADGSYLIRGGIVVSGSGSVVANAGPDQSITLPTSSVTLTGASSSGTITSYAWTFVSGPNVPVIVTPTTVTTSVTGLIQGTYVFQLSVNGGVSTDQVSIIVNPAIPAGGISIFTTQVPASNPVNDGGGINYTTGLKFRSTVTGTVTAVRFYKGSTNVGTHTGLLYSSTGTLLSSVVFTGESVSGWQTMNFPSPVSILANTTYVVALFNASGWYTEDVNYFNGISVTNGPITALADGTDGCNAPFDKRISGTPSFPASCFNKDNYWVDIVFVPTPPPVLYTGIYTNQIPTDTAGNDAQSIEVGVKFRSSVNGYIYGVRFYKKPGNIGTHIGQLYSSAGALLGSAQFTFESDTGWQQVLFPQPVFINANTTYIGAYFSSLGWYTGSINIFTGPISNPPITGLADGTDGHNSIYLYTGVPAFPTEYSTCACAPGYWVDILFTTTAPVLPGDPCATPCKIGGLRKGVPKGLRTLP